MAHKTKNINIFNKIPKIFYLQYNLCALVKTEESVSLSKCLGRLYIPDLNTKITFKDGTQEQFATPPATLVNLLNMIRVTQILLVKKLDILR